MIPSLFVFDLQSPSSHCWSVKISERAVQNEAVLSIRTSTNGWSPWYRGEFVFRSELASHTFCQAKTNKQTKLISCYPLLGICE